MTENGTVLGIVGSPNPEGITNQLVAAALKGAADAGAPTELILLSENVAGACKDCLPWVCKENLKCTFEDEAFDYLSRKILSCGALVMGTPVYWWDTSGLIKYLILKMFRVYAPSAPLHGLPALGLGIAGGTGNGLISGLRPLYHFFQIMQMRAIEPVPATRFNLNQALQRACELGTEIAGMASERCPFEGLEERLIWYDSLPYLGLSRAEERRLLADLITMAVPEETGPGVLSGLARSDALAAAGRSVEALTEITKVYEAGVKAYNEKMEADSQK